MRDCAKLGVHVTRDLSVETYLTYPPICKNSPKFVTSKNGSPEQFSCLLKSASWPILRTGKHLKCQSHIIQLWIVPFLKSSLNLLFKHQHSSANGSV